MDNNNNKILTLEDLIKFTEDILLPRFDAIDKRFDAVDKRFDAVDDRLNNIDAELMVIRRDLDWVKDKLLKLEKMAKEDIDVLSADFLSLKKKVRELEIKLNTLTN